MSTLGGDPVTDVHTVPVGGVVLCGGASKRMGTDKATIGDPPWAHRVAEVLESAGCAPVVLVGEPDGAGSGELLAAGRWELMADRRPRSGPAAALADCLAELRARGDLQSTARLVVAACDLPHLATEDVANLNALGAAAGGVAAYILDGRPQLSLLALDPAEVQRVSRTSVAQGMSMRALLGKPSLLLDPLDPTRVRDIDEQ